VGGKDYHPECFTCNSCEVPLGSSFYPQEGKLYCAECLPKPECAACGEIISGEVARTHSGLAFHPECFTCRTCHQRLVNSSYLVDPQGRHFCNMDCLRGKLEENLSAPRPPELLRRASPTLSQLSSKLPEQPGPKASTASFLPPQRPVSTSMDSQDDEAVFETREVSSISEAPPEATPLDTTSPSARAAVPRFFTSGGVRVLEDEDDALDDAEEAEAGGEHLSAHDIFHLIDVGKTGAISRLTLLKACQSNPDVSRYLFGEDKLCQRVLEDDEEAFDELCEVFERISGGRSRINLTSFSAHFGIDARILQRKTTMDIRNSRLSKKVLIIGPGFGAQINPAQKLMVEAAGFQISFVHVPNPEVPTFPVMQFIGQIVAAIESFKPDVLVAASKGGVYVTALWNHGLWTGSTLLMNAHPTCTRLPPNTTVVIAHGSNDEVYHRPRDHLEHLISTGSANKCFLYYTQNSGPLPDGRLSRMGDMHNMQSILQYDCLPRLIDAAMSESQQGPEMSWLESWHERLSFQRVRAEAELGLTPERLQRFWTSLKKPDGNGRSLFEVPRESEEFEWVASIFSAQPREPAAYQFPSSPDWDAVKVLKVERVENKTQMERNAKSYCETLQTSIEAQGLNFKPGIHTRWAFHGTQQVESIVNDPHGFQPLAGSRCVWGLGTYFARDAKYVSEGGFCLKAKEGSIMLMCLLMNGMPCLGDAKHQGVMPYRQKPHRYNSAVDSLSSPEIFIMHHSAASLPAYVITFTTSSVTL